MFYQKFCPGPKDQFQLINIFQWKIPQRTFKKHDKLLELVIGLS